MASNLICVYINLKVLLFMIIYIEKNNSCSSSKKLDGILSLRKSLLFLPNCAKVEACEDKTSI